MPPRTHRPRSAQPRDRNRPRRVRAVERCAPEREATFRVEPVKRFADVRAAYARSDGLLRDRRGRVLHELRVERQGRRLDWVRLEEVSPALLGALLHAEDRRFYSHGGVDWVALAGSLAGSLGPARLRGASTITMQVAAEVDLRLRAGSRGRSLGQKWLQMRVARALERRWSKAEVLEAYLNLVSFRGELQGLRAAARGLFEKEPHGLDDLEAVVLAALVRSPNAPVEAVARRAAALCGALGLGIEAAAIEARARDALARPYFISPEVALAPHVAGRLLLSGRREATSTLDGALQAFALGVLRHQLAQLRQQNVQDGALLVAENATGDVLAYVGNTGEGSSARHVDGVQAARQAGSTLKPFLYATAFERRYLTPASLLEDSPVDIPAVGGIYRPHNYDNRFNGPVTARVALASSLNVPAVRTLNLVGVEAFVALLGELGLRSLRAADFYGASLALGSADVTLWDLANGYRTLANGGRASALRLQEDEGAAEARQVLAAEAAFLVSDVLSDRESRSRTFHLESPLATRFWTAVKTGTSKDMRDNWCIGYSSRYTVGVWVGNFSGEPMWNVSGISGAAPVWVEVMSWLHRDTPSHLPAPPPGVLRRTVTFADSGERRGEWFLAGTEAATVAEVAEVATPAAFRITYPATGTIVALDPDIPPAEQKLFFEAEPRDGALRFVLDGAVLGSAGAILLWSPTPGPHTLALADAANRTLDAVRFEVRGAMVR